MGILWTVARRPGISVRCSDDTHVFDIFNNAAADVARAYKQTLQCIANMLCAFCYLHGL